MAIRRDMVTPRKGTLMSNKPPESIRPRRDLSAVDRWTPVDRFIDYLLDSKKQQEIVTHAVLLQDSITAARSGTITADEMEVRLHVFRDLFSKWMGDLLSFGWSGGSGR
jgi:hypothetical protein